MQITMTLGEMLQSNEWLKRNVTATIENFDEIVAVHEKDKSNARYFEGQPETVRLLTVRLRATGESKKMLASVNDKVRLHVRPLRANEM